MTTGDPSAPKPAAAARTASRAVPKKTAAKTVGTREPRVSASKAGAAAKRGAVAKSSDDDILDRLSKLDESPVVDDDPSNAMPLPTIVEADPTYPPVAIPAAARADPAVLDRDETSISTDFESETDRADGAEASGVAAERDGTRDGGTEAPMLELVPAAVSADLPTALVESPEIEPDALTIEALAPTPERTQIVPLVPVPSTDAIDETSGVVLPKRPLRAPMRFRRAKPRVRRVTRVVRHVDTWSVFKVALVFAVMLYLVCLTSGVLLWNVAHATGTVDNVEKFFEQFGWESFEFKGGEIYHNAWIGGLFVAIGLTGFTVLLATLFNLITDLVGGIRVSVLEEEVVVKQRVQSTALSVGTFEATSGDGTDGIPLP